MVEYEKVISGLEHHIGKCEHTCDDESCPYWGRAFCETYLCKDVLELLEEQKPRVLTLKEIKAYINSLDDDKKPLWLEWSTIPLVSGWVFPSMVTDLMKRYLKSYNINWRPWTSRPTVEQMKAVKWDV